MHRLGSFLLGLGLACLLLLGAGPGRADAAASRVVALEWDAIENLTVLGVTPVGVADLSGYDTFVPIPRSRSGITDVGLRTAPSLTRIASLRPDLIIVPDYRSAANLSSLRRIAPVLVTRAYPSGSDTAQYDAMVRDFRKVAAAVGRRRQGEAVLRDLDSSLRNARLTLAGRGRAGIRVTLSTPGGSLAAPAVRIFTDNSVPMEVMRRIGLRNAWQGRNQRFGYATVGIEAYRQVQSGWLAFVFPEQFRGIIDRFTSQPSFRRLEFVREGRVRTLPGSTWLYGGPRTVRLFAERMTAALISRR